MDLFCFSLTGVAGGTIIASIAFANFRCNAFSVHAWRADRYASIASNVFTISSWKQRKSIYFPKQELLQILQLTAALQYHSLFLKRFGFIDSSKFNFVARASRRNTEAPITNSFLIRLLLCDDYLHSVTVETQGKQAKHWNVFEFRIPPLLTLLTYYSLRLHIFGPSSSVSPITTLAQIDRSAMDAKIRPIAIVFTFSVCF